MATSCLTELETSQRQFSEIKHQVRQRHSHGAHHAFGEGARRAGVVGRVQGPNSRSPFAPRRSSRGASSSSRRSWKRPHRVCAIQSRRTAPQRMGGQRDLESAKGAHPSEHVDALRRRPKRRLARAGLRGAQHESREPHVGPTVPSPAQCCVPAKPCMTAAATLRLPKAQQARPKDLAPSARRGQPDFVATLAQAPTARTSPSLSAASPRTVTTPVAKLSLAASTAEFAASVQSGRRSSQIVRDDSHVSYGHPQRFSERCEDPRHSHADHVTERLGPLRQR